MSNAIDILPAYLPLIKNYNTLKLLSLFDNTDRVGEAHKFGVGWEQT